MLSTIRKRVRIVMIIVAVAFVAGFLLGELWTVLRSRGRGDDPRARGIVGRVGDHQVTETEYRGAVAYATDRYKQENGLRDLANQDYEAIENRAWQWLTTELTWAGLMEKTGVTITEEEVVQIMRANPPEDIRNNPELRDSAGNFDHERYLAAMNQQQNQPYFARYFQELAEMLPKEKLRIDMASSFRITPGELEHARRTDGRRVQVTSLYFGQRLLDPPVEVTDEEARQYFETHRDEFKPKATRQLNYVSFPRQVSAADSAEAAQAIGRAAAQLEAGESFNLTMLDFSDLVPDTAGVRAARSRLDPATDSVIRTLKPGQHSGPFLAPYGWQIVALDSITEDTAVLRRILVRVKLSGESFGRVRDEVESFLEFVADAGLESLAAARGLRVSRLRPLVGDEPEVGGLDLVNPAAVADWALRAKPGDVMPTPARSAAGGYYVFQLAEYRPAVVPEFEEVKRQATWRARQEKEKAVWNARAREVLAEIRAGRPLEQFAGEESRIDISTEPFEGIQDCRRRKGPEFAGAVKGLDPGQISGVVETGWGAFIVRLDAEGEVEGFDVEEIARQRQEEIAQQVMRELVEAPEVKDYRDVPAY
ncbi:MAG: peptidyl-prolyl cis-trans isomerase [bacterium]